MHSITAASLHNAMFIVLVSFLKIDSPLYCVFVLETHPQTSCDVVDPLCFNYSYVRNSSSFHAFLCKCMQWRHSDVVTLYSSCSRMPLTSIAIHHVYHDVMVASGTRFLECLCMPWMHRSRYVYWDQYFLHCDCLSHHGVVTSSVFDFERRSITSVSVIVI